jgi:hypothetical protein
MSKNPNPKVLASLMRGLSAVAGGMEPREAAALCGPPANRLVQAMSKTTDVFALRELAQGLLAVAARLETRQGVNLLSQAMSKTTDYFALRWLAQGLSALAARLEPRDAKEAANRLAQTMSKTTHSDALSGLARGLSAVAARLEPREAAALCGPAANRLTQAMSETSDHFPVWELAKGLSAVAARLEPREAADRLVQAMSKTTDVFPLSELAQGLSAVLTGTTLDQSRAAVVSFVGLAPQGAAALASFALLQSSVRPLPCRLSTPELVELLKHPLCVGEARRVVLDRLEDRYGRKFADQWEFVRFATEQRLGLDFTTPPQRPEPVR